MEFRVITKAMGLYPYQQLFFSTHEYEAPRPVFPELAGIEDIANMDDLAGKNILLLTGIASPEQMRKDLQAYSDKITPLTFSDHHHFSHKDVERINEAFRVLPSPKLIITTEKDACRLTVAEGLSEEVRQALHVLPIHVKILQDQEESFNKKITGYVRKNSKNSVLAKGKDDHLPNYSNSAGNRPRTISFRNN